MKKKLRKSNFNLFSKSNKRPKLKKKKRVIKKRIKKMVRKVIKRKMLNKSQILEMVEKQRNMSGIKV